MKKIVFAKIFKDLSLTQYFTGPLSKLLILSLFMGGSVLHLHAQCPSPAATTPAVTASSPTIGATTTTIGSGSVTYVNGNVVLGTSNYAYSVTISLGTTWVISAGSHLTVTNLAVGGTLILQSGATVSVVGLNGANGILSVLAGGVMQMCENSGIENCGNTTFTPNPSVTYVGTAGGRAVIKATNKIGFLGPIVGTLVMPLLSQGLTYSANITVATPSANFYFPTPGGSYGSAVACTIGGNCAALPFAVSSNCGEFAGQTALTCSIAGASAPALSATAKANICPATTVNLTTLTASNTPSGATLTWHTGTPATNANKITGTAVGAGTYYAAFYDAANNCYSGASGSATTAVTATVASCASVTNPGGTATNVCPATTVNLNSYYQGTIPSGTTVTWHTGTPATSANKYTTPTTASAGTYYAAFEDATNNCYSPTMGPVVATVVVCCVAGNVAPILIPR